MQVEHPSSFRPVSNPARQHFREAGISLIEVLITLLIVSVGLLGLAGLQAAGLRNNASAYHRTQANGIAYDLLDSMRANRGAAIAGAYNFSSVAAVQDCGTSDIQAKKDCENWVRAISEFLPDGEGNVNCDTPSITTSQSKSATFEVMVCAVGVGWDDTRSGNTQWVYVSTQL